MIDPELFVPKRGFAHAISVSSCICIFRILILYVPFNRQFFIGKFSKWLQGTLCPKDIMFIKMDAFFLDGEIWLHFLVLPVVSRTWIWTNHVHVNQVKLCLHRCYNLGVKVITNQVTWCLHHCYKSKVESRSLSRVIQCIKITMERIFGQGHT